MRRIAKLTSIQSKIKQKATFDKHTRPHKFKIGNTVLVERPFYLPGQDKKLLSRFNKEFKIIGFQGPNQCNVKLRDFHGNVKPRSVSINKIKLLQERRLFPRLQRNIRQQASIKDKTVHDNVPPKQTPSQIKLNHPPVKKNHPTLIGKHSLRNKQPSQNISMIITPDNNSTQLKQLDTQLVKHPNIQVATQSITQSDDSHHTPPHSARSTDNSRFTPSNDKINKPSLLQAFKAQMVKNASTSRRMLNTQNHIYRVATLNHMEAIPEHSTLSLSREHTNLNSYTAHKIFA